MNHFRAVAVLFVSAGLTLAGAQENTPKAASQESVQASTLSDTQVEDLALSIASGTPPPACVSALKDAVQEARSSDSANALQGLISFQRGQICPTWLLLSSDQFRAAVRGAQSLATKTLASQAEKEAVKELKSMSQQNGASVGTGGGTDVTSKGLASKVLSVASQYGALTESTSGQTTTASGSFAGVPTVLLNRGLLTDCSVKIFALTPCGNHKIFDYLTRLSYSVSFDTSPSSSTANATPVGTSSGTAQRVNVTGSSRSVSALGFKWVAWQLPPKQTDIAAGNTSVAKSTQAKAFAGAAKLMQSAQLAPTFLPWYQAEGAQLLVDAKTDSTGEQALEEWESLGTAYASALGINADIDSTKAATNPTLLAAKNLAQAAMEYIGIEETTGQQIARAPVLSFEYDDNRPASAPSNSVFRAIYQGNNKAITVTANGALSIYNEDQNAVPGASRLRDFQMAAEVAHNFHLKLLSDTPTIFTMSGAFYDQYQNSPAILNVTPGGGVTFTGLPSTATQVFGTTGNIALGQVKLTAGSGSAVTVPLSVTYSNRTELITNPTWKAQIGVSYDFDSLFGGK